MGPSSVCVGISPLWQSRLRVRCLGLSLGGGVAFPSLECSVQWYFLVRDAVELVSTALYHQHLSELKKSLEKESTS